MKAIFVSLAAFVAMCLSACTAEQAYYSAQGWQRNRCYALPDKAEYDRCMNETSATYESYKRQLEAERK